MTQVHEMPETESTVSTAPKFIISSAFLGKHITALLAAVSSNPIVPILENILFVVDTDGTLTLTASDLHTTIIATLPSERLASSVDGRYGFSIEARKLYRLLNSLPEQPLIFRFNTANQVSIMTDAGARYNFYAENWGDFPKLSEPVDPSTFTIPGLELSNIFLRCLPIVSDDDLRPAMTGIYIDGRYSVATNGHGLVRLESKRVYTDDKFIISARSARIFLKAYNKSTSEVSIAYNVGNKDKMHTAQATAQIKFSFDNFTLISRLIDEKFPDYQTAIPAHHLHEVTVNRQALIRLLGRVGEFANRVTHQVRLEVSKGKMAWLAEDLDNSSDCSESIAATTDGELFEIGFNAKLLSNALKSMTGATHVQFRMSAPNRAALLHPTDGEPDTSYTMLVMPVMLSYYNY